MAKFATRPGLFLAALLGMLFVAAPGLALLVRPIVINLTSSGSRANSSIEVVNDRNRAVAVEVKVNRLTLPERGPPMVSADPGKDFLIFPAIASIPAGGRQVFRVRYIGDPALAQSKLFMFSSSELPVAENPTAKDAQIQVLYSIHSVVTVSPPKARPAISVVGVERGKNAKGESGVFVTFRNDGPAHGFVNNAQFDLEVGSWSKKLEAAQLGNVVGLGLIPANARRVMFITMPDVPAVGQLAGRIKVNSDN